MRPIEKCAHGVPFFGTPYPVCRECDLLWERACLEIAQKAVERHTRRIAAWFTDSPDADTCGTNDQSRGEQNPSASPKEVSR